MNKITPTFEQSINASMVWSNSWERGELSDEVIADKISELLVTRDGARGFLVISLSSDCPLMDRLPDPLIFKLREAGEIVVDLIVRNLAMSSAMTVQHQRNKDEIKQSGSERIKFRCLEILRVLEPNLVKQRLESLLEGTNGSGEDFNFLQKWGYDKEQILAISSSIQDIAK